MPIDQRRRDEIAAAVAAYDRATRCPAAAQRRTAAGRHVPVRGCVPAEPGGPSPRKGSAGTLPATLRRLVEAEFLSRERGSARMPDTYRLHLPALVQS